ncbi:threalose-6-phosphate phosphatase, partial [Asimina triloba]
MDDTYDVYGKLEELEAYTTAIERWDWAAMDELPDYMKLHFSALLTAVENFEEELSKEGKSYRIPYLKKAFTEVAKGYLEEARWASAGYIPTVEEYMKNALMSSTYPMHSTVCLVGMGDIVTNEALQWTLTIPDVIKAVGDHSRLKNDLVSNEREQGRVHVATGVQCYMTEFGTTYDETCKIIQEKVADYWKDIKKDCLEPIPVPRE